MSNITSLLVFTHVYTQIKVRGKYPVNKHSGMVGDYICLCSLYFKIPSMSMYFFLFFFSYVSLGPYFSSRVFQSMKTARLAVTVFPNNSRSLFYVIFTETSLLDKFLSYITLRQTQEKIFKQNKLVNIFLNFFIFRCQFFM